MADTIRKNDEFELTITDLSDEGTGIGRSESNEPGGNSSGFIWFVKDALIGDRIFAAATKVKKNYGFARLVRVLEPSPYRVKARCPEARRCGGCQIQEMDYEKQLEFKEDKVRNDLIRIGGFEESAFTFEPIMGMEDPWRYRNKAVYPVGKDRDGNLIAGFYAGRTHSIIRCEDCLLGAEKNQIILEVILSFMKEFGIESYDETTHAGVVRHVLIREGLRTGELMVSVVINAKQLKGAEELCQRLKDRLPQLASFTLCVNREKTNVIMGDRIINVYGPGYIEEEICEVSAEPENGSYVYHEMPVKPVRFRISPLSFFQVNSRQMERLYGTALEFAGLTGKENVWDLYCGVGTISLFLSKHAKKVYGVEIIPAAIENARENAALNDIGNAEFYVGRAEEVLPQWYKEQYQETGEKIDVIVVDPPRKGCDIQCLETMVSIAPERIVYVSCDPATLARDLKYLCANGYRLDKVRPCDMFGHTVHIETVCLLSKLSEVKNHISVKVDMNEMDLTAAESKATYQEIKEWVKEKYGFQVSHLNIAKTKRKCGIIERQNYNLPKSEDSRSPEIPKEKEEAIIAAFKAFRMI